MFNHIDAWLIRQYQTVANWTDVRYDKNCYWWGYVLTEAICPLIVGYVLVSFIAELAPAIVLGVLTAVWLSLLQSEMRQLKYRRSLLNQRTPVLQPANRKKRKLYLLLFIFLIFFNVFTANISTATSLIIMLAALYVSRSYFDACLPMPPAEKERKQAEAFDGLAEGA